MEEDHGHGDGDGGAMLAFLDAVVKHCWPRVALPMPQGVGRNYREEIQGLVDKHAPHPGSEMAKRVKDLLRSGCEASETLLASIGHETNRQSPTPAPAP
mmetsp:Transcript_4603/g.12034  ORF Transcript_4603/g.12034 Transcript_4603/m.12034 type:complete len:99 (-) Transcript_4603:2046-2342(-)